MESSTATAWQFYPLVASSSLLFVYLAFLILRHGYSRSKLVQGWTRRMIGKPPKEEKMLLHTLPYYLAITRTSCEVVCLFCLIICFSKREQKTQLVAYFTNGSVFPIVRIACIKMAGLPGTCPQTSDRHQSFQRVWKSCQVGRLSVERRTA